MDESIHHESEKSLSSGELPSMLTWTDRPPTRPGFYFMRFAETPTCIKVVRIHFGSPGDIRPDLLRAGPADTEDHGGRILQDIRSRCQWAGPIPVPTEQAQDDEVSTLKKDGKREETIANPERIRPGDLVQHFKRLELSEPGDRYLYRVLYFATHTETKERLVVYRALYDDHGIYVRPMEMFFSEVDRQKYPHARQKYRFEAIGGRDVIPASEEKRQIEAEMGWLRSLMSSLPESRIIDRMSMEGRLLKLRNRLEKLGFPESGRRKSQEQS